MTKTPFKSEHASIVRCLTKISFKSFEKAKIKANNVLNVYNIKQEPYYCCLCSKFHLKTIKD